jgi:TolA-binding protein
MIRWQRLAPLALLASAGCLASKGDIRLMQEEFRATRSQIGIVDTSIARANDQLRRQIATLAGTVDRLLTSQERLTDSLRVLTGRFYAFQANANGELELLQKQSVQVQELLGQNVRSLQATRAQLEQLQGTGAMPQSPTTSGAPAVPQGPGAATLFTSGKESLANGAWSTARRSFEQLLTSYPNADEAARATLYIGDSYLGEQNKTAADSVYQLVVERYPKTDEAPTAMWKRATKILWDVKKPEARALLEKIGKDYPNSSVSGLARDFLRNNK